MSAYTWWSRISFFCSSWTRVHINEGWGHHILWLWAAAVRLWVCAHEHITAVHAHCWVLHSLSKMKMTENQVHIFVSVSNRPKFFKKPRPLSRARFSEKLSFSWVFCMYLTRLREGYIFPFRSREKSKQEIKTYRQSCWSAGEGNTIRLQCSSDFSN